MGWTSGILAIGLIAMGNLHAQTFGDWVVEDLGDGLMTASTSNASGGYLMRICVASSHVCIWALSSHVPCISGSTYIVLMNASTGARALDTECRSIEGLGYAQKLVDYEALSQASEKSTAVAFAFPLEGGAFRVSRFSLAGSKQACAAVEAMALRASSGDPKGRDITL